MISSLASNNWITILFIVLIGLLVIANYFFEKRFLKFRTLFYTKQYIVYYVSNTTVFHPFNIIFLLFQAACYALLALKVILYTEEFTVQNEFALFLEIALGIITFYTLRYLVGKVIAVILKLQQEQDALSFMKISQLAKVSLIIFPFLILLSYFEYKNGVLFVALAIYTAILLLIKYINLLVQNQKFIFKKLFYFILYLCALEILPLALIFKVLLFK